MFEYVTINDATDDLTKVNEYAAEGWRVIAASIDARRGPLFVMERELEETAKRPELTVVEQE